MRPHCIDLVVCIFPPTSNWSFSKKGRENMRYFRKILDSNNRPTLSRKDVDLTMNTKLSIPVD